MTAVSRSTPTRMRDQIDFGEARLPNLPAIGLDGNVMLQQGAGFGQQLASQVGSSARMGLTKDLLRSARQSFSRVKAWHNLM